MNQKQNDSLRLTSHCRRETTEWAYIGFVVNVDIFVCDILSIAFIKRHYANSLHVCIHIGLPECIMFKHLFLFDVP